MKAATILKQTQHNIILNRLQELGVKHSRCGKSLHDLDYRSLKRELVLVRDFDHPSEAWF